VRAPVLPVEAYLKLTGLAAAHDGANGATLPAAYDPLVRCALAVASADLLAALDRAGVGREASRVRAKLLRYLIRMSTRPTPYGLFAGVGLARWGTTTDLAFRGEVRTRMRPDMGWLVSFVTELERRPEVRRALRLAAHPAAFLRGGRVFLTEPAPAADEQPPSPVSVRATAAVRRALTLARRPIPYEELLEGLLALPDASVEKAERVIEQLCQQTFLLTDLRPPLTGSSPARYVAERLSTVAPAREDAERLERLLAAMDSWDSLPIAERAGRYVDVVRAANAAHAAPTKTVAQVDAALSLEGQQINEAIAAEAARAAELLLRISPWPPERSRLEAYRQAFESRYERVREVPLLELLDPGYGLGPPADDGALATELATADSPSAVLRQQTLQHLAASALRDRQLVVELDEETIARLESWAPSPTGAPCSLDLLVFVASASPAAVDSGEFMVVVGPNVGAPAAGRNLGRFADLLGAQAQTALEHLANAERARSPRRVFAELVYLPYRWRSANVAIRPAVHEHEITLGTTPGVAPDGIVPLDELRVGVRDGRFYVRWPAADAEVTASAGHMLNNRLAPAVCRFLEDVSHERTTRLFQFDWGPAAALPFLPRVQSGRVVLGLAQWRIDTELRASELPPEPTAAFRDALARWRERWTVPRHVYLSAADNRLLLDLDDAEQAEQLRQELGRLPAGGALILHEPLPGPGDAWLPGPRGHHVAELVVPLVLAEPAPANDTASRYARESEPARTRLRTPGSDWLFIKLYGPRALEDDLIRGPLRNFCQFASHAGLADTWFFIRYADPDPHLRLRFHGPPQELLRRLLPELCAWATDLIAQEHCHRFSIDTYERELERYGGAKAITLAESIFAADSHLVAELFALERQWPFASDRTTLAVLSTDDLLRGLGLTETERLACYHKWAQPTPETGREHRSRKTTLRRLLGDPGQLAQEPGGQDLARLFAQRRAALAPTARGLDALAEHAELGYPKTTLCRSYVHLHHNRLVGADMNHEELVLELLRRTRTGLDRSPHASTSGDDPAQATAGAPMR